MGVLNKKTTKKSMPNLTELNNDELQNQLKK